MTGTCEPKINKYKERQSGIVYIIYIIQIINNKCTNVEFKPLKLADFILFSLTMALSFNAKDFTGPYGKQQD